jgi:hypothetical protein
MLVISAGLAVASGFAGLLISYHADIAAGGTIVLTSTAFFLAALALAPNHGLLSGFLQRRSGVHHQHHYHPSEEELPIR